MGSNFADEMRKGTSKFLGIGQVDVFVWPVSVMAWAENAHSVDLRLWVLLSKLSEERNRTANSILADFVAVKEISSGLIEGFAYPTFRVPHAPTLSRVSSRDLNLASIRNVLSDLLDQ